MNRFLLAAAFALTITACSKTNYPTYPRTEPFPDPGESRYPNPGSSGDNSTSYPAEGQKDGVVTIIRTGGGSTDHMPPGQAKKKYGSQSAKVYAPGQRKKNGGNNRMATVISVPDLYASRATSGQLYFNYRGNTYRKQNDGYYHLDQNDGNRQGRQKSKGKGKKYNDDDDD